MNEEEITQIKLSMPLIDDIELNRIDNFYNDIVDEYLKCYVKEKEQIIIQQLLKNLRQENRVSKQAINELSNQVAKLVEEKKCLKAELDILTTNYKTLSADIGTVAEYMKLNNEAIIEEMIDRVVELVKKENIIDELEKWLEEEIKHYKEHFEFVCKSPSPVPIDDTKIILEKDDLIIQKLESTLNKLQELKGSDNNE